MSDTFYFWYERTPGGDWSARTSGCRPTKKRGESKAPRMSEIYTITSEDLARDRSLATLKGMMGKFPPPEDPEPTCAVAPDPTPPKPTTKGIVVRPTPVPGEWDVELHGVPLRVFDDFPRIEVGESLQDYLRRVLPKDYTLVFETQIRGKIVPEKQST